MLQLRNYQSRSLGVLESYLGLVAEHGARAAFVIQAERPYHSVPSLPDLPYVCLRVPTGGGKTLMACHALGTVARQYLQAARAICLWLVPSNTIRDQTLSALRDRTHAYRQAVESHFMGRVSVMDLTEALYVQRGTLEGETSIIVSTLAALRVEDTDGRKVYEPAGALGHHFTGLDEQLAAVLEKNSDGTIPQSLANVLRLWRPVVVMDEAHNARTPLSFETLARFNPSCIIEFTATPETSHKPEQGLFASNLLHQVSAAELKDEEMVKLPIKLRTHDDWKEVLAETLQKQRELEEAAKDEHQRTGEYLRPIVLLQAQAKSKERQTLTVDVLKQSLVEDFKIPEEQIKKATGEERELDEVEDLLAPTCPVRFIITVQALKEGWDCPFAYILCSVSDVSTPRAVEQVLGRILRMPHARRKQRDELNCAYAYAASPHFIHTAQALKDALVENGFQKLEADDLVIPQDTQQALTGLFPQVAQAVSRKPDLADLWKAVGDKVRYVDKTGELVATQALTPAEKGALLGFFLTSADQAAVEKLFQDSQRLLPSDAVHAIAAKGAFNVPLLAIRVNGHLELFEETHFLDTEWNLAACDSALSEREFAVRPGGGQHGVVDVDKEGHVEVRFVAELHEQLALLGAEPGWTVASLANWLDRQIPHRDVSFAKSSLFIHNVLTGLIETRGVSIEEIARRKFRLRQAIEVKIREHRNAQAKRTYQRVLFGGSPHDIEVSPALCFAYDENRYGPNSYYEGEYRFAKHYFYRVGELKREGEEFECAVFLDQMPDVKFWVRNLDCRPESSFWLQTSTDRFYPDFVAMLLDGRILVVEYKNIKDWSNDDSKEKRAVGELWADRSAGRCLFVMPRGMDLQAIVDAIRKSAQT